MKFSAILPAFNEATRINKVIRVALAVPSIAEIIVIDDGSTDGTATAVLSHPKVKAVVLPKNMGKTWAVIAGVKKAKYDHLLLLDADLQGLYPNNLEKLIKAYSKDVDLAILDYGSQEQVLRKVIKSFPALSGVRILSKFYFSQIVFKDTDRFELENRINNYFMNNQLKIIVVPAKTVYTPHKYVKYGWLVGSWLGLWAIKEILYSNGRLGVLQVFMQWRKLAQIGFEKKLK